MQDIKGPKKRVFHIIIPMHYSSVSILKSVLDFELFLKNRREWPTVNSTGNSAANSANSGKTWEELAQLQNQTAPKQSKL